MYKFITIVSNFMPKEINLKASSVLLFSINRNSYIRIQTFVIHSIHEQIPDRKQFKRSTKNS